MEIYKTLDKARKFDEMEAKKNGIAMGNEVAAGLLEKQKQEAIASLERQKELKNAAAEGMMAGAQMTSQMFGGQQQSPAPLGMSQNVSEQMGQDALLQKANSVVDQLDAAQEQGAPSGELAQVFNSLDPSLKAMVQKVKQNRLQNQQNQMNAVNPAMVDARESERLSEMNRNRLPGSAVERMGSPITQNAAQIAAQSAQIGNEPQQ